MRPVGPAPTTITSVEGAAFSGSGRGSMPVSLRRARVVPHHPPGKSTRVVRGTRDRPRAFLSIPGRERAEIHGGTGKATEEVVAVPTDDDVNAASRFVVVAQPIRDW